MVVNGASRFLNKIYCTDLSVSGATTFATVTATGLTVNGNATITGTTSLKGTTLTGTLTVVNTASANNDTVGILIGGTGSTKHIRCMSDGIQGYTGSQNGALYFNYWGGDVYLSNGNSIKANNGTFTATNYIGTKGTIANLMVTDTLRSFKWDIDHVANLGGTFLVTPTYIATVNSATIAITVPSAGNPITATITDNAISSGTLGGIAWNKDSKIKISGKLGGIAIGTCDGTLTAPMNGSNHTLSLQFTYPGQTNFPLISPGTSKTYSASEISDLTVMLLTVGATYPIGIYMTARDSNNYSHISLYGGTSEKPTVRIGNLSGLDAVGGADPDEFTNKWGIYTSNGFFKGAIAAERGIIGSNTTVTNNWQIGDRSIWYGSSTPGASTSALVISTGTSSAKQIASSPANLTWMLAAGTGFGVTNTGVLYATGATVTGEINADSGRFGPSNGYHISFDSSGMYVYQNASTKVASYGSNIVLGNNSSGHTNSYISMDYHSFQMISRTDDNFVWFSDLRDSNGIAEITDYYIGNGDKDNFTLSSSVYSSSSLVVKQDDSIVSSSAYTIISQYNNIKGVKFNSPPSKNTKIEITYSTAGSQATVFTLGKRDPNSDCGVSSFAEGYLITASGPFSHAEGYNTTTRGFYSHTEGYQTTTYGEASHAEGYNAHTRGSYSHAEGGHTDANGTGAHAEGYYTTAEETGSHAEGRDTVASGYCSHAEGSDTVASNTRSHAEGTGTVASNHSSHAGGYYTIASGRYQTAIGKYNISDTNDSYAFIIGNGTTDSSRSNALTVDWKGNVVASGNISASNFFPVNSIYVTSTNTNPNSILGFGTWTLFDKHYAPAMITDAFTLNSTNVSALSGTWVKMAEHNILIRVQFTNKVAYADNLIDVGTFNLAKIGLASGKMPWHIGSGYSDNGNAIVMPNIDGSGKIQIQDVVANGTATQIAAGSSIQVLFTINIHTIADMLDSFCDKFFWKRTA